MDWFFNWMAELGINETVFYWTVWIPALAVGWVVWWCYHKLTDDRSFDKHWREVVREREEYWKTHPKP